jgi:SOS-response transcriptional repressor LexA
VPLSTLAKLTSGATSDPKLGTLKALARVLECSLDEFGDSFVPREITPGDSFAERYSRLDGPGRRVVEAVLELELERSEGEETNVRYMREYVSPAAAGIVSPVEGDDYVLVRRGRNVPEAADFAVRIAGDSMEPYISDGSRVFVSRSAQMKSGDIGIFFADGGIVCKQYCEDGRGGLFLLSLNRARSDADVIIRADSGAAVYCFGKVLGVRAPLPEY